MNFQDFRNSVNTIDCCDIFIGDFNVNIYKYNNTDDYKLKKDFLLNYINIYKVISYFFICANFVEKNNINI